MQSGILAFPAIERIPYGKPAAEALLAEAERMGTSRVFLMVSRTMNRTTDEVAKVRDALGGRYAGVYDAMPPLSPREAVLDAARAARAVKADLIVTFGGGSLTDAGKMVRLCLQHGIDDLDGFDAYRSTLDESGKRKPPTFEGPSVHQVSIPTTLSAGDFNASAGCMDHRSGKKHSYAHPLLIPRIIILDPAPAVHTPLWVWLSTGIRALDHATEGLCSQSATPISERYYTRARSSSWAQRSRASNAIRPISRRDWTACSARGCRLRDARGARRWAQAMRSGIRSARRAGHRTATPRA